MLEHNCLDLLSLAGLTARLLELARTAFEREVEADPALRERARASAERQIRALLATLGFSAVHFVEALPATPAS